MAHAVYRTKKLDGSVPLPQGAIPLNKFSVLNLGCQLLSIALCHGWTESFLARFWPLRFNIILALLPGNTPQMSPELRKSVIVNRQCGYEKSLGVVTLGVGQGGLRRRNFLSKCMLFFTYFTKIRACRTTKIWGRGPSARGSIPVKCFWAFVIEGTRCILCGCLR